MNNWLENKYMLLLGYLITTIITVTTVPSEDEAHVKAVQSHIEAATTTEYKTKYT
jgi:hypothetical protein